MAFGKRSLDKPLVRRTPPVAARDGENRWSVRRRAALPGLIYPGGVAASIPCTITDQSITGACLALQQGWANPYVGQSSIGQHFVLVMRADRLQVDCEIVRIDEQVVGVRFVSAAKPMEQRT